MGRIRVILIGLTQMLREIVLDAVAREPDMKVVRSYSSAADLATAVEETSADVALVGANEYDPATVRQTLRKSPKLKIVSISDDARPIALFQLVVRRRSLGDLSPSQLAAVIRAAAHES